MSASPSPPQPEMLTSWKEIASYLGKGIRTVQRWELQFGLPVRRPNEKAKGVVYATCQELDLWLASQWSQRSHEIQRAFSGVHSGGDGKLRESIRKASALREANRRLCDDLRAGTEVMRKQCELLRHITRGQRESH